jgi:hypothetical protein
LKHIFSIENVESQTKMEQRPFDQAANSTTILGRQSHFVRPASQNKTRVTTVLHTTIQYLFQKYNDTIKHPMPNH